MSRPSPRPVEVLIACQPPGLTPESARRWRVEAMLREGYGFQDVAVESRRWSGRVGAVTEAEARRVWDELELAAWLGPEADR